MSQTNLIAHTYNPHNQSVQELIDGFVVRRSEFQAFFNDIKTDRMHHPPQHAIIQGRRGSGKTTFLLRLKYEINRDAALSQWLLPLIFNEEQYAIRTLFKLWEQIAIGLENEFEEFAGLPDLMDATAESADYEELCFDILKTALFQHNKKLLLLIDNFGDMLQKFTEHEHRRLREILITCPDIKIVGASSVALEATFDYAKPFFEFFKIIELPGLSREETTTLLRALGDKYQKPQIEVIIAQKPGKIEALRRLTDGVPRTMILLFEIFIDNAAGDSFKDLEMVLDRVTPLYKHRMDDLSAQQQELVDVIALQWDAVAVKEIAQKSRMESKAVSAQLRLLEKNRMVIKKQTSTKNHLYQISERFFNIWYLMRYGRKKEKAQVLWLTRFLEEWCDKEELLERAKGHLAAVKSGVVYEPCAFYMTEALAKTKKISVKMQDSLVKGTREYLLKKGSSLAGELSESDLELLEKAKVYIKEKKYELAIKALESIHSTNINTLVLIAMCYELNANHPEAEMYYKRAIKNGNVEAMYCLALLYQTKKKDIDMAEKYYKMASDKGDAGAMYNLALLYETEKEDINRAETYYILASEKGFVNAMFNLALLYETENKINQAEKYYKMASDKGLVEATNNLALLYETENKIDRAEKYYKIASDKGCKNAQISLSILYFFHNKNKSTALDYMTNAYKQDSSILYQLYYSLILLWNNDYEKSTTLSLPLFSDPAIFDSEYPVKQYLLLLIAKKQHHFALRLFTESPLNLRERYRPIYFALMYFMQDSHPDEFRKMGSELEETVMEIVEEIRMMEAKY